MKKKQLKIKETEKANAEIETPKNVDYIEISMTHEGLEKVAQDNAILLEQRNDPVLRRKFVRRQEKLLRKVFKAASQVLTTKQFEIWVCRFVYQMPEEEIATQIGCVQNYISASLKASIKKVQKRLRIPVNLKGFSRDRKENG
jgi:DNA-directed RNA polymerase specialized sigma subunit